jgi:hypothetical protein
LLALAFSNKLYAHAPEPSKSRPSATKSLR